MSSPSGRRAASDGLDVLVSIVDLGALAPSRCSTRRSSATSSGSRKRWRVPATSSSRSSARCVTIWVIVEATALAKTVAGVWLAIGLAATLFRASHHVSSRPPALPHRLRHRHLAVLGPPALFCRMTAISLTVNGRAETVDVDPATPLLYVLSDDLKLRGPKFGCGLGQCGVLHRHCRWPRHPLVRHAGVVGPGRGDHDARRPRHARAAASDSAGLHRRAGRAVRLLPERRHPHGQGVSRSEPRASEAEMRQAMNGVLCRCFTHVRMFKAIRALSGRHGMTRRESDVAAALALPASVATRLSPRRRRADRHLLGDRPGRSDRASAQGPRGGVRSMPVSSIRGSPSRAMAA